MASSIAFVALPICFYAANILADESDHIPYCRRVSSISIRCSNLNSGSPTLQDLMAGSNLGLNGVARRMKQIFFYGNTVMIYKGDDANDTSTVTIDPDAFQGLTKLKWIQIQQLKIQSNFNQLMQPLRSVLKSVKLYAATKKDDVKAFSEFTKLKHFLIQFGGLEEFPTQILQKSASTLIEINLGHNNISTLTADHLKEFPNLKILSVQNNQLSSLESGTFASLKKLIELELQNNRLTNISADMFRANTKLSYVDMRGNPTTGLRHYQFFFRRRLRVRLPQDDPDPND